MPSTTLVLSYHQVNETLWIVSGKLIPVIGRGNLSVTYSLSGGIVSMLLRYVARAPELHYNLFSLRKAADADHDYVDQKAGITIYLHTDMVSNLPSTGRLNYLYSARKDLEGCPTNH